MSAKQNQDLFAADGEMTTIAQSAKNRRAWAKDLQEQSLVDMSKWRPGSYTYREEASRSQCRRRRATRPKQAA